MRIYPECYPCFFNQALNAARLIGSDDVVQHRIVRSVLEVLLQITDTATPPEVAYNIQHLLRNEFGGIDPYAHAREQSTREALELYPHLKDLVASSPDPLETAILVSIAGNIIDLVESNTYDIGESLQRVLGQRLSHKELEHFQEELERADTILFLGDNAGETVFDRVLIETLQRRVLYVVKGGAVLNDAIRVDAEAAGLHQVAEILDNGTDAPGTLLPFCSETFRQTFEEADLIISKGQANFETLSSSPAPIYFLLQVKCSMVAREFGVPLGTVVFRRAT